MRDGLVYKTKPLGFAHRDRPKGENEIYTSLSTQLLRDKHGALKDSIALYLME